MAASHNYLCTKCFYADRDKCQIEFKPCPRCKGTMIELSWRVSLPKMKKRKEFIRWYWNTHLTQLQMFIDYEARREN